MKFEDFRVALQDASNRRELLFRDDTPYYVLLSQQFEREDVERLCDTATSIRRLDRNPGGREFLQSLLRGRRIMNLFAQPSTRTAESFIAAADKLGASTRLVSDLKASSIVKGETVEDSVRVLSSFFDCIVTRHHDEEFALRASWTSKYGKRQIPVISAGAGKSQHVTQSLLDVYTLRHSFAERGDLDGKRILIVGDISRNRGARSLAYLIAKFSIRQIDFVAPEKFRPDAELMDYLKLHQIEVQLHESLEPVLRDHGKDIDAMYMTRLQQEWDGPAEGKKLGTSEDFVLKLEYGELIRENCVIMHPLPRVNELPEEWDEHPGSVIWQQVRNGMWMRAALFATVFGRDTDVRHKAKSLALV